MLDRLLAKSKRRSKNDVDGRDFKCKYCDKTYLSYPALYTHMKQKHSKGPDGEIRTPPTSGRGRGRPRKNVSFLLHLASLTRGLTLRARSTSRPLKEKEAPRIRSPISRPSTTSFSRVIASTSPSPNTPSTSTWFSSLARMGPGLPRRRALPRRRRRMPTRSGTATTIT